MASNLKFGLYGLHHGVNCDPDVLGRRARAAESAGFESLWVGDHIVIPTEAARLPGPRDLPRLEAVTALTFMAAHTTTARLAAGVIVLPQRNPVVLAKELASLDALSRGRLIVGIGAGWLEPEFQAVGAVFNERGARTDDYLAAMRALWADGDVTYDGRFVSFGGVVALPLPVQRPCPPIVIGGYSPAAYRRTVTAANGWYGFGLDLDATARALADLRRAHERHARPTELGEVEITVAVPAAVDGETAAKYAALGVHRLVLMPADQSEPALERLIDATGASLIGQV